MPAHISVRRCTKCLAPLPPHMLCVSCGHDNDPGAAVKWADFLLWLAAALYFAGCIAAMWRAITRWAGV